MIRPRILRPPGAPPDPDAIAAPPGWLSTARAALATELALVGGGSLYENSAISLYVTLASAELDDLPHPLVEAAQGGTFIASFEGRCGAAAVIAAKGRLVDVSCRVGLAPCQHAFYPRDGRGEVVSTREPSGTVARVRNALCWLAGSFGEPESEMLRVASLGRLVI